MGDGFLALIFLTAGFAPLAAKFFVRSRTALLFGMGWLIVGAAFLLRPGANSPHAFGALFFLVFFIEWLAAMCIVWINRDQGFKEISQ